MLKENFSFTISCQDLEMPVSELRRVSGNALKMVQISTYFSENVWVYSNTSGI